WSIFSHVDADLSGNVYALRQTATGQTSQFELWRSLSGSIGSNLSLATTFDSGYSSILDLATDASGCVYVCAVRGDPLRPRWHILKGAPGPSGLSWSVVYDYAPVSSNQWAYPKVIAARPAIDSTKAAGIWVGGIRTESGLPDT